jgi:hypothetical protein
VCSWDPESRRPNWTSHADAEVIKVRRITVMQRVHSFNGGQRALFYGKHAATLLIMDKKRNTIGDSTSRTWRRYSRYANNRARQPNQNYLPQIHNWIQFFLVGFKFGSNLCALTFALCGCTHMFVLNF